MKTAILVIAATVKPLYRHYINHYWTEVINYTNTSEPDIDVYLLFDHSTNLDNFSHLRDNIIQEPVHFREDNVDEQHRRMMSARILSKTTYALELLKDKYDVFFRTNLSSMIRISLFKEFINNREAIGYSGGMVWKDSLRKNMQANGKIGADKKIKSLSELDCFIGNSFVSGCGYFLNRKEATHLVQSKDKFRYEIADDVMVGLMMESYELLRNFIYVARKTKTIPELLDDIHKKKTPHIRIQHFPLPLAQDFWHQTSDGEIWK